MITIKEIAEAAGVSVGTVSNVLSGKANVSSKLIKIVEETAETLGYKVDIRARRLRLKSHTVAAIIIPNINLQHYVDFYLSLKNFLEENSFSVEMYTTDDRIDVERQVINQIAASRIDVVVSMTSLGENDPAYNALSDNVSIYFVGRKALCNHKHVVFTSFDYEKAGNEIAQYIISHGYHSGVYFANTRRFAHKNQMYTIIRKKIEEAGGNLQYLTSDNSLMLIKSFDIFNNNKNFDYIVTANIDRARAVASVFKFISDKPLPCIITLSPTNIMNDHSFIRYEMNFKHLGQVIGNRILANSQGGKLDFKDIFVENDGIDYIPKINMKSEQTGISINILAPECHAVETIRKILPNFTKRLNININISTFSYNEPFEVIESIGSSGMYDIVCMDASWLSEVGKKVYKPISKMENWRDIIPGKIVIQELAKNFSRIDNDYYCFPLDPSTLILLFRRDLFENFKIRRAYFEMYHEELSVPKSFEQYNRVASFFTKSNNINSPTQFGTTLDFNSTNSAANELYSRLVEKHPKGLHDVDDIYSLVNIKNALSNLLDTKEYTQKSSVPSNNVINEFANGKTAMCLAYSSNCTELINSKYSSIVGKIGFAPIPGECMLIQGNVIGIAKNSTNIPQAVEFMNWLFSNDISTLYASMCGTSPCKNVYNKTEILDLYPWLSISEELLKKGSRHYLMPKTLHQSDRHFEKIIGFAARNAITDSMSNKEIIDYLVQMLALEIN